MRTLPHLAEAPPGTPPPRATSCKARMKQKRKFRHRTPQPWMAPTPVCTPGPGSPHSKPESGSRWIAHLEPEGQGPTTRGSSRQRTLHTDSSRVCLPIRLRAAAACLLRGQARTAKPPRAVGPSSLGPASHSGRSPSLQFPSKLYGLGGPPDGMGEFGPPRVSPPPSVRLGAPSMPPPPTHWRPLRTGSTRSRPSAGTLPKAARRVRPEVQRPPRYRARRSVLASVGAKPSAWGPAQV